MSCEFFFFCFTRANIHLRKCVLFFVSLALLWAFHLIVCPCHAKRSLGVLGTFSSVLLHVLYCSRLFEGLCAFVSVEWRVSSVPAGVDVVTELSVLHWRRWSTTDQTVIHEWASFTFSWIVVNSSPFECAMWAGVCVSDGGCSRH